MATDPMNIDRPRFRKTRFATTGIPQPTGPVRPSQPSTSAMTSGPPATPRLKVPPPGRGTGIIPSSSPSAMPTPIGDERQFGIALDAVAEVPPDVRLAVGRDERDDAIAEFEGRDRALQ